MPQEAEHRSATRRSRSRKTTGWLSSSFRPFRTATLRGLAIILPPLLTIIFFVWAWNVIESYVLRPVESALTRSIGYSIQEVYDQADVDRLIANRQFRRDGSAIYSQHDEPLSRIETGQWIPTRVIQVAETNPPETKPKTAADYYANYVQRVHLKRYLFIPAFLALFLGALYLLGKLLAVGIGRIFLHYFENLITRLPIIRNVYSSVKQVTDFALNENEMTFTRIVAVEYPRRGVWSMGFVTGEGMRDIKDAAGEPMLTILMPTSPMPATGFVISVPKSETIDLNITIDQAVQFCVSCGVVVPDHQQIRQMINGEVNSRRPTLSESQAESHGENNGSPEPAPDKPINVSSETQPEP